MDGITRLVYGIYPRSDELRVLISRTERGKAVTGDLRDRISRETEDLLSTFRDSSDIYSEPCVNWHDFFRPVAGFLSGFSLGKLQRYLQTNTFYREPVIESDLSLRDRFTEIDPPENLPAPLFGNDKEAWLTLPSPHSIFQASKNPTGIDEEKFSDSIFRAYAEIATELGRKGIVLRELFPYSDRAPDFLGALNGKFKTILVAHPESRSLPATGRNHKFHSIVASNQLLAGAADSYEVPGIYALDGYNTKLEDAENISRKSEIAREILSVPRVVVTSNQHFDFLPRVIADRKLAVLKSLGAS